MVISLDKFRMHSCTIFNRDTLMLKLSHTAGSSRVGSEAKRRASGVRSTHQMCYRWITLVEIQYDVKYAKKSDGNRPCKPEIKVFDE